MRYCKSTSNVLYISVLQWQILWWLRIYCRVPVYCYNCVYVWVIVDVLLLPFKLTLGCLFSPHHVIQGDVLKTTPQVTLNKTHSAEESLRRRKKLAGTARYCLAMRAKRGNSCWCFFHHMRGSVSLETCCTRMYAFSSVSPLTEDGLTSIHVLLRNMRS
jgi:hypothetical protein